MRDITIHLQLRLSSSGKRQVLSQRGQLQVATMSGRGKGKSAKKAVSRSAKAGLQVRGDMQNLA